jgi:hypothetical protein
MTGGVVSKFEMVGCSVVASSCNRKILTSIFDAEMFCGNDKVLLLSIVVVGTGWLQSGY